MAHDSRSCAQQAVAALDAVLEGPSASHADLAKAIRWIVKLRNALIDDQRAGREAPGCLARVNSLLSLAFGAEFPLMGFHRDRIKSTRDAIAELNLA